MPHLVKMYGRSAAGTPSSARRTTSSECPSPYTAAVSIQLIPRARACRIVAIDSSSSCGPQPKAQSPPPTAQAPKPTVVMVMSVVPSRRVVSVVVMSGNV